MGGKTQREDSGPYASVAGNLSYLIIRWLQFDYTTKSNTMGLLSWDCSSVEEQGPFKPRVVSPILTNPTMQRGTYFGRENLKVRSILLRSKDISYSQIAKVIGVPASTIAKWTAFIKVDKKKIIDRANSDKRLQIDQLTSKTAIRNYLIRKRGLKCQKCLRSEWNEYPIILEVHHKDGNTENNSEDNLELNCPNCHSCTATWRKKKRVTAKVAGKSPKLRRVGSIPTVLALGS